MNNKSHWSSYSLRKGLFSALKVSLALFLGICVSTNASAIETSSYSTAQQSSKTVKVNIKDAAGPLAGASVLVKGTSNGADSDLDGNVVLNNVPGNAILVVSFIGYQTQEIAVTGKTDYQVVLVEDADMLDELVVIGYGAVKKRDLTGAVASVKSKELTEYTVPNPVQALQGRVAGVNITNSSGSPAGNFKVRIRGANSILGNNDPLYVVDGMPGTVNDLNAQDIESIEVLKDASATAIYGSRGANGVVLITTKSGKTGQTHVEYNGEVGFKSFSSKIDLMDAQEYMTLYNETQVNDGRPAYFTDEQIRNANANAFDWMGAIYRNALIQNHSISVNGGTEKTRFNISGGAMLNDGIIKNTAFNKYNLRTSIDHDISKIFNVSLIMGYTLVDNKIIGTEGGQIGQGVISCGYCAPPTIPAYNIDADGNKTYVNINQAGYPTLGNSFTNAVSTLETTKTRTKDNTFNINGAITAKPIKGLSIKATFGMRSRNARYDWYRNSKNAENLNNASASVSATKTVSIINENIVNYNVTLGQKHDLGVMGAFTYQQEEAVGLSGSGSQFLSDVTETYNLGSAIKPGTPGSSYSKWSLMSYLARVNYGFDGRYLLTASIRADGSSRYSDGSKWGYFPSAAFAWRMSNESWMKNAKAINDFKFRIGYGVTGSTAISPYQTQNTLGSGTTAVGSGSAVYFRPSGTLPGDLKWESTSHFNFGIDLAMFDNRLRFTADAYYKLTTDLLSSVTLPRSSGYSQTYKNVGSMSNKGIEFMIEGDIISTKDWHWSASYNMSVNRNRVEELYGGVDIYREINQTTVTGPVSLLREGEPMGVYNVYEFNGYDENGYMTFKDQNGDGALNEADRKIFGNPHPDFIFGFNTEVSWKGLGLSMFWNGSVGNDVYNCTSVDYYNQAYGLNQPK
ncbi:MAG: TonB-dependent receptor, partial [Alistipes sp.]|nr:TonB-dependent receptor [Candidatus Minthomonas equi]